MIRLSDGSPQSHYWGGDFLVGKGLDLGKSITISVSIGIEHFEFDREKSYTGYPHYGKYRDYGNAFRIETSFIGRLSQYAGFGFHFGPGFSKDMTYMSYRLNIYGRLPF